MTIELEKLECPSCGAGLKLSSDARTAECDSCGGVFLISRDSASDVAIAPSAQRSARKKKDGDHLAFVFLSSIAFIYLGMIGKIALGDGSTIIDDVRTLFGIGMILGVAPFAPASRAMKIFPVATMVLHVALLAFLPSIFGDEIADAADVSVGVFAFGVVFLIASFNALRKRKRDR